MDDALNAALDALPWEEDATEALREALLSIPAEAGLRATFTEPLEEMMAAQPDAISRRWAALRGALPTFPPFSYLPIRQLVIMLAQAGSLLFPERALMDATNAVFEEYVAQMESHTTTRNIRSVSNDDLFAYLEVVNNSTELWYNFGERRCSRPEPEVLIMHYSGWYTRLSSYWVPGLNRGLMRLFEERGEVALVERDPMHFDIHIRRST